MLFCSSSIRSSLAAPPAARSGSIRMPDLPMVAIAAVSVAEEDAVVDAGPGVAVAAQPCPPDILQRGKSSREYSNWYTKQYMKQHKRKRRDAARRGDASALATLREIARKAAERRRKLAASARRGDALAVAQEQRVKDSKARWYRRDREQRRKIRLAAVAAARVAEEDAVVDGGVGGSLQGGAAQALPGIV